ncbi:unnamed protein product [Lepidochelys kempii]
MDLYLGFVILEGLLALAVVGTNLLVCATICLHRELRSVTNCLVALPGAGRPGRGRPGHPLLRGAQPGAHPLLPHLPLPGLLPTGHHPVLHPPAAAHRAQRPPENPAAQQGYAMHVRKGRVLGAVGLCWLLSLLIGLSPHDGLEQPGLPWSSSPATSPTAASLSKVYPGTRGAPRYNQLHDDHLGHCSFTSVFAPDYLVYFIFFACTLLPLGALLGIYADLFRLCARALPRPATVGGQARGAAHGSRPSSSCSAASASAGSRCTSSTAVRLLCPGCWSYAALDRLAVLLSHLNSLANPLVYAMRKKDFGRALRAVCLRYVLRCPRAKVHPQGLSGRR